MKEIKITVVAEIDRERMCLALANSGYKVWIETKKMHLTTKYYVCFEFIVTEIE